MNSDNKNKDKKSREGFFYNFLYDFVKVTGAPPAFLWLRPKVYNPYKTKIPKGAVLLSSNHITFIDPIIILLSIPSRRLHSLATKDLYDTRLKAWLWKRMHCIQVDKSNFTLSAFHEVVQRLKRGHAVLIFPEGQINQGDKETPQTFKSGVTLMAYKANAPILPIYIVKKEKWYHRQRVIIGKPIYVGAQDGKMPTMQDLTAASEELRMSEIELREYFRSLPIYEKLYKSKGKEKDERKV